MDCNEFYRLINTLLYTAHEKLPTSTIPQDEHLVSDQMYSMAIRDIVNQITGFTSEYSPKFEFQPSPFDSEKIIPVITYFECSRMFAYRKGFNLQQVLKAFNVKL